MKAQTLLMLLMWPVLGIHAATPDTTSKKISLRPPVPRSLPLDVAMQKLNLVAISALELGFTEEPKNYDTLSAVAQKQGFRLCSPETVVAFRNMYYIQPFDEKLLIAIEPCVYVDAPTQNSMYAKLVLLKNDEAEPFSIIAMSPSERPVPLTLKFIFLAPYPK